MKTFRLTSWIIWGLSIVVAITLAVLHRTDLIEQFKNDGGLESGKYSWSRIE